MNDQQIDRLLHIETNKSNNYHSDYHHSPYEPTSYKVLDRILESNLITSQDTVIDYGCGKGRVSFYLNYKCHCKCIGIEYDQDLYKDVLVNQSNYKYASSVAFICIDARRYEVKEGNICYFFNPFSVKTLEIIMYQLVNKEDMTYIFYYPTVEYETYLNTLDEIELVETMDCSDLFHNHDPREKILVYKNKQV